MSKMLVGSVKHGGRWQVTRETKEDTKPEYARHSLVRRRNAKRGTVATSDAVSCSGGEGQ